MFSLGFTLGVSEEKLIRHDNFKRFCERDRLTAKELTARFKDGQDGVKGGYSYWQGLLNGSRPFGERIARRIEHAMGWSRYSLDEAPNTMPEGYVRLDNRERALVDSYRALSKEAKQLDFELAQFGEHRQEAYHALLECLEEARATLLNGTAAPAATPSAPSGAKPKKKPSRTR